MVGMVAMALTGKFIAKMAGCVVVVVVDREYVLVTGTLISV
jgi:ribosomal protein L14E/L6E/L27E